MGQQAVGDITIKQWKKKGFVSMCEENNFVIGGTFFAYINIHKLTWTSTDGNNKSEINHIMINSKWKHTLQEICGNPIIAGLFNVIIQDRTVHGTYD